MITTENLDNLQKAISNNDIELATAILLGYNDFKHRVKISLPLYENVHAYQNDTRKTLEKPKVGEHVWIDIATFENAMSMHEDWQECECTHVHANVWFFKRCDDKGEEFYVPSGCLAWCRLIEPTEYHETSLNSKYYQVVSKSGKVVIVYDK